MDPDVFPEPMEFRPERYLDKEGKVINRDTLIGFGLGKNQGILSLFTSAQASRCKEKNTFNLINLFGRFSICIC